MEAGGQVRLVVTYHADGDGILRIGSPWAPELRQAVSKLQAVVDRTLSDPLRTQVLRALTAHLVKKT